MVPSLTDEELDLIFNCMPVLPTDTCNCGTEGREEHHRDCRFSDLTVVIMQAKIVELQQDKKRMLDLLRSLEYIDSDFHQQECPVCCGLNPRYNLNETHARSGHRQGCRLDAELNRK
jgi:hypothetical protein